ncbi:MAG: DUF1343 domain-containing protein [Bacteroidales bacterium]|nr:DUF1343 domain-containing protein [Bacteroidales bacterium]
MKFYKTIALLLFSMVTVLGCGQQEYAQQVLPGIEVLKRDNFKILEGKRVGLITNPTGFDNSLKSTIDILYEAPNVNLVALFGPEHGVRGDAHAGDKVQNIVDSKTGIPVLSLYGSTRKATPEMLQGIDVLVYDIQDIGSRSFTYISTMGLAMEAAAEQGIEFVILDRPNPLGGIKVEGNLVEEEFISFVSQFKIPYIYGLTCGELAMLLNQEGMLENRCDLHVVAMEGWSRDMTFEETGLQWVPSSPHIPHPSTSAFYPISGILGELGYLSIGVGYTIPFQMFAAEWLNAEELAQELNSYSLPGITFRPIHLKPFYSVGAGTDMQGVQVHIMDYSNVALTDVQFYVMEAMANLYPERAVFDNANEKRYRMFDQVCGSDQIRILFSKRHKFQDIKEYWHKDIEAFKRLSKQYYLY